MNANQEFELLNKLEELLVCVSCKSRLKYHENESVFRCINCCEIYPVKNNVVIFDNTKVSKYVNSFSSQWGAFSKTQLDTEDTFESKIRFSTEINLLNAEKKVVAEYGCGAGRFLLEAVKRNPDLLIGIDASESIFVSAENLKKFKNTVFLKADIANLPIDTGKIDFGYCVGVLHHTENPHSTFLEIGRTIKAGGQFALSVYENNLFNRPDLTTPKTAFIELMWALNIFRAEVFRSVFSRLPTKLVLAYCYCVVPILHLINKVPLIRYFRYLLPSTCYRNLPVSWSMCDTMDTYATKIVHQYRAKTIFQWFSITGFKEIELLNSRAGWVSIKAKKGKAIKLTSSELKEMAKAPVFK